MKRKTINLFLGLVFIINFRPVPLNSQDLSSFLLETSLVDSIHILDPVVLELKIINTTDVLLEINHPDLIQGTIELKFYKKGNLLDFQTKWSAPRNLRTITLEPNDSSVIRFDLTKLIHVIDEGAYVVTGKYFPFLKTEGKEIDEEKGLNLPISSFVIKKLSVVDEEIKTTFDSLQYICANGAKCIVHNGLKFIETYPSSIFSNVMKFKVGDAYRKLKDFDKSIEYFNDYLKNDSLHELNKNAAFWRLGWVWYYKGETKKAVDSLEQMILYDSNRGRVTEYINRWRLELDK